MDEKEFMKKISVFGKPGGGKSTLSKKLSVSTGIKVFPLDLIEYRQNGERVPKEEFLEAHEELITSESWIIDGLGTLGSFWSRVDAADTLIYVDLAYRVHYWWVIKRLLISLFVKPEGWPEGSSVLKGTVASWKYLRLSPYFWTSELFEKLQLRAKNKSIYRITSVKELNDFVEKVVQSEGI